MKNTNSSGIEKKHSHRHSHDECGHCHGQACVDENSCGCEACSHSHDEEATKKDYILIAISAVLFALSLLPVHNAIKLILQLAAVMLCGYDMFFAGFKSLLKLDFNEMTLMTIAVAAAFAIGEYNEAAIVTILFKIGEILENKAVSKSREQIEAVTKIRPETAHIINDGNEIIDVKAKNVAVGTKIIIKPGETVPIDCRVVNGSSLVDLSAITGESMPVSVSADDTLLSGSINTDGLLTCVTVNSFNDSAASRIIELVKESKSKKSKTENFITRFSKAYTPFIIISAAIIATVPALLGYGSFIQWVSRSLVFLVASCPCALVISVPLSFFAGIGACSKRGVLIKGSKYLEALSKANIIAFDKTGTLTTGKMRVSHIESVSQMSVEQIKDYAAAAERFSNHPIARAVAEQSENANNLFIEKYQEIKGKGVSLAIGSDNVLCGSRKHMEENGVDVETLPNANVYLAVNGRAAGYMCLSDTPRDEIKILMPRLKELGFERTAIVTGDSKLAATEIQKISGADDCYAQLMPEQKVEVLEQLKQQGTGVIFVGDGINDAPVLAAADIGFAMGLEGTDAAVESADGVIMSNNLLSLIDAVKIARTAVFTASFNIWFALMVKAAVLILGVFGLAQMWLAVFADVGVSAIAVFNAARILKKRIN